MPRHTKQNISYDDLLAKIQSLLNEHPKECHNIHIDGIQVYREQVDDANWRVTTYRRSGYDNDLQKCRSKIASELRLLRKSYDVKDES